MSRKYLNLRSNQLPQHLKNVLIKYFGYILYILSITVYNAYRGMKLSTGHNLKLTIWATYLFTVCIYQQPIFFLFFALMKFICWYWGLSLLGQIHLLLRDVTLRRPWVMFSFICPNSLLIFCYLFSISLIYCPWQSLASIPLSLTICCFLSLSVIVLVSLQFQKIVFHNTLIHNGKHLLCLCVLVFILLPFFPLITPITSIRQKGYTRKDNVKYLI